MTAEVPATEDDLDTRAARLVQDKRGVEAVALLRETGEGAPIIAWQGLAELLWQQGDHAGARSAYEQVLLRTPRDDTALIRLSQCLEWSGDLAGAKALLRGDGIAPLTGRVAARLGHILLHSGEAVNAEGVLRFAVAQPDAPASAWRDLSETLHVAGRRPDAMAIARAAHARMPEDAEIRGWLGSLLLDSGEAALAAEHLGAAQASGRAPPFVRIRYAEALFRSGQKAACVAEARQVLDEPPVTPPIRALVGYMLIQCGEFAQGEALMTEAIAAEPLSPGLHLLHSAAHADCGRDREATIAARAAAEALPENAEILNRYGQMLLKVDEPALAGPVFNRALAINPDLLHAWIGLCEAARQCKRFKEAIAAFRKLGELGADAQVIRDQRYRLFGEMT